METVKDNIRSLQQAIASLSSEYLIPSPSASPASFLVSSLSRDYPSMVTTFILKLISFLDRKLNEIEKYTLFTLPNQIETLWREVGRRTIAEATAEGARRAATMASHGGFMPTEGGGATATSVASEVGQLGGTNATVGSNSVRNLGGVFNYVTSKWAIACLVIALILNRTQIHAATRRPAIFRWPARLTLRIIPIILFVYHSKLLLQAMRCQTSPQYSAYQDKVGTPKFHQGASGSGRIFYKLTSALLFWQDDLQSCQNVKMMPSPLGATQIPDSASVSGSLALLWPLFNALGISQFVETLYCTLEGRQVMVETSMTIFEHSLAFAEAEAVVSNNLGWGPFGASGPGLGDAHGTTFSFPISALTAIKRSTTLTRFNTTPEVLLVGLISSLSHLTSQVLGTFGLQARFRLWTTGSWGLLFMSILIWSSMTYATEPNGSIEFSKLPTVCIIGFVPHILILIGIGICGLIYSLALSLLVLTATPEPGQTMSLRDRFEAARENLQVAMHFSSIGVSTHEDFFSALLKVGFIALTAASEAVFLNEGRPIGIRRWTWLEEDRVREVELARASGSETGRAIAQNLRHENAGTVAEGIGLADESEAQRLSTATPLRGGYAREKSIKKLRLGETGAARVTNGGVGATERSGRWIMVWELFRGISLLVVVWFVMVLAKVLENCGMQRKPRWMTKLLYGKNSAEEESMSADSRSKPLEFWLLSDDGVLTLPRDNEVDVEAEMRKRMQVGDPLGRVDEEELDKNIYGWWKQGGWFGELDASGDFALEEGESETTSAQAESSAGDNSSWDTEEDSDEDDGRATPTKDNPFPQSRPSSPLPDLTRNLSHLAQLLNPKTQAQRQEALVLSHHFRNSTPLTRSQYWQRLQRERTQILTSTRRSKVVPSYLLSREGPLSADEEAELLEHIILSRRSEEAASSSSSKHNPDSAPSWTNGGSGLGSDGPQCVVCQTSPRIILVWPCRCLSLCEDCRVSLAMNNFGSCVCCRRDVLGFSRIYVP